MSLHDQILRMSQEELEAFRARLRRRYDRDALLDELRDCAHRLGASPTMREFAADRHTTVHPQTIVEHFGSWNDAKRRAGLVPRRNATRDELVSALRALGERLQRTPTGADIEAARGTLPGKAVYIRTFGSLRAALKAAGFDAPTRDERLVRAVRLGAAFHARTGRLPSFRDWDRIRGSRTDVASSWQIYRAFERSGGAWSAFQCAVERCASDADRLALAV